MPLFGARKVDIFEGSQRLGEVGVTDRDASHESVAPQRKKGWLKSSTIARAVIRSCSICFGSAQGANFDHATIFCGGIIHPTKRRYANAIAFDRR